MDCNPNSHMWNQVVPESDVRKCDGEIKCGKCTEATVEKKCYIGDRYATVEMRRKFSVFADGNKQFADKVSGLRAVCCWVAVFCWVVMCCFDCAWR